MERERGIFLSERGIKFKTVFSGIEYAANNKCENKFPSNTIFGETAAIKNNFRRSISSDMGKLKLKHTLTLRGISRERERECVCVRERWNKI